MDTHVLVLIDTDQIPKILRQPECMCPSTEAPVARHLFLRSIPEFRASDASDRRSPFDPQCVVGIFPVDSEKERKILDRLEIRKLLESNSYVSERIESFCILFNIFLLLFL